MGGKLMIPKDDHSIFTNRDVGYGDGSHLTHQNHHHTNLTRWDSAKSLSNGISGILRHGKIDVDKLYEYVQASDNLTLENYDVVNVDLTDYVDQDLYRKKQRGQ